MPNFWVDVTITIRGRLKIQEADLELAEEYAENLTDICPDDLQFVDMDSETGEVYEVKYKEPKGITEVA
jgi:hypothetical protein